MEVETFLGTPGAKYLTATKLAYNGDRIQIRFGFNMALKDEIKASMTGVRWLGFDDGPKAWEINNDEHNNFRLKFMAGEKPYEKYDIPLLNFQTSRSVFAHQLEMVQHALTRRYCIFACEMGTGKTLAAIEIMEASLIKEWWYIAPKSALTSVQLELMKWKCKIMPKLMTYEGLVKEMNNWTNGRPAPQAVIFDECSKIKSPTAKRTQASMALACGVRKDWGDQGFVILMSGSPAPKSPADWWAQCMTARPGYIREGNYHKFQERLAIIQQVEGTDGIKYPKILGWRDNADRCGSCAELRSHVSHMYESVSMGSGHEFVECKNEVELLFRRMKGLVLVKHKKDCLDLPEKQYRTVKVKPSIQTLNAAKLLQKSVPRAAEVLLRLRELSDGFQYDDVKDGTETCPRCNGVGKKEGVEDEDFCHQCVGEKVITKWKRIVTEMPSPKDEALLDLLEEHDEDGRIVIFAGFTATIDRAMKLCKQGLWKTICVDGRGWRTDLEIAQHQPVDMLNAFQNLQAEHPRIAFIGHPGSAGMGLTLTASQSIIYYSNDFNAESRIQSEDRIHRPGCRGANIIDIVHLPTDQLVIDNLKKKRELQSMTLGEISSALERETNV